MISALGTTLDAGLGERRWDRWRPTVGLCQHEDLIVDRLELLYDPRFDRLAEVVVDDIAHVSPETEVLLRPIALPDPWDFERVYATLLDAARARAFVPEREDILVQLGIPEGGLVLAGFDRPNIRYRVMPRVSPAKQLADFIAANPGPGIVYCPTRDGTERMAERLAAASGRSVAAYHAGLDPELGFGVDARPAQAPVGTLKNTMRMG